MLSTFAHEAAGAAGTRHSLRPLLFGGKLNASGAIAPRERGGASGALLRPILRDARKRAPQDEAEASVEILPLMVRSAVGDGPLLERFTF